MANNPFQKAVKYQLKLRLAFLGPAGSGKTYSALQLAKFLGGKTAFMDTEHESARKYADKFDFDVVEPNSFSPDVYIDVIQQADDAGYDILIIDSLSHAWAGKDGILEFVDEEKRKSRSGNAFTEGWGKATPKHNALIEAMLSCKMHLIVTMRTKMEYVIEEDPQTHKKTPRKIGLQPIQRDGLEYEFDVVGDFNQDNDFHITKTRCFELNGKVINKPGKQLADILKAWLADGVPYVAPTQPAPLASTAQTVAQPPAQSTAGASAPATHPPPKTAQVIDEAKPAGNGAKPDNTEKLLDDIGAKLWPGLWAQKKPAVLQASNGDMQMAFDNVLKRQKGLEDSRNLRKHIAASWAGYETLLDKMVANGQQWRDPLSVIRGINRAATANTAQNMQLDDSMLLMMVTTEIDIPEGFSP